MDKKIIVFFHIYYIDLIDEYLFYLNNIKKSNFTFDLYISISKDIITDNIIIKLNNFHTNIITYCENYGADINGFFTTLRNNIINISKYHACMYLHTKKSIQYGDKGIYWRNALLNDTLISPIVVNYCVNNIHNNGIIGSSSCISEVQTSFYDKERSLYNSLCNILNIPNKLNAYFIAGTIFWMNINILKIIIDSNIHPRLFNKPFAHSGLLEHGFERIFGTIAKHIDLPVLGINLNINNIIYKLHFCPLKTISINTHTIDINENIILPNQKKIYDKFKTLNKFKYKYSYNR